jgi:AAA+ ATPase superfamily predicted ATPase
MGSSEAELVSVHGRRRVGKTFLIREHLAKDIAFELTGVHGAPLREQLRNFATSLAAAVHSPLQPAPPRDWQEAFRQLSTHLDSLPRRSTKRVIFFDELPWLASRRSGFLRAFEHFWNAWAVKRRDLVVIVCGSASAWMVQRVLQAKGGLHNRVTRQIRPRITSGPGASTSAATSFWSCTWPSEESLII